MLLSFIVRRFFTGIITILAVASLSFFIFSLLPGDPAQVMLGLDADEEAVKALRQQLKLDDPWIVRFGRWIFSIFTADFGDSITYRKAVNQLILESLPPTLSITLMSSVFTLLFSFPLGLIAIRYHNRIGDYFFTMLSQIGMVVPSFWIGILLLMLFTEQWRVFPFGQYVPFTVNALEWFRSIFLPSLAVSLLSVSLMARMIRSAVLENLKEDYVRTAKSKGVSQRVVLYKHVLKNSLIPVLTLFGLQIASILAGSIIIENVFSISGIGRLLLLSVQRRDLPVVQGIILWVCTVTVIINFATDILHSVLDPRVQL